ncbi:hypothetical protein FRC12_000844 [Ceratobasidium sp. 428]|nr:hypothetical protein FRC12_000844 [Ceratobasidium sp. 428]
MAEPIRSPGTVSDPIGEGVLDPGTSENRSASRASDRSRLPSRPASVHEHNLTGISPTILNPPVTPPTPSDPPCPTIEVAADPRRPIRHSLRRFELIETISKAAGIRVAHISLIRSLTFGVAHIVAIGVLLGLASQLGSVRSIAGEVDGSSTATGQSQWEACRRSLAAWDIVWTVKAAIGMGMAVLDYRYAIKPWAVRTKLSKERDRFYQLIMCIPWTLRRNSAQTWPQYSDSGTSPLPRELVDRIPPAVYIPTVIQDEAKLPTPLKSTADGAKPNPIHPPQPDTSKRTQIRLLLSLRKTTEDDPEAIWEKAEHPFVSLEPNRAVCAICRVDFEPPR